MANQLKPLSIPSIAAIRKNHPETGNAIQTLQDYINQLLLLVQPKKTSSQ